jgi:hypothetical protein
MCHLINIIIGVKWFNFSLYDFNIFYIFNYFCHSHNNILFTIFIAQIDNFLLGNFVWIILSISVLIARYPKIVFFYVKYLIEIINSLISSFIANLF